MPFPWTFRLQTPLKADEAVFNTKSKIYFGKITGLLVVKKKDNVKQLHGSERTCPTKPI